MSGDRVLVDAIRYTGRNSAEVRLWMGGQPALSGSPEPGDWVIRVRGGVRVVPHEVFAITYVPAHDLKAAG